MWYIYTIDYYSGIKRMKLVIFRDMDGPRVFIESEVESEKEKEILYINVYARACTHAHTHTQPRNTVEMTFWQGRNRDTDREQTWTLGGKRGRGELRDWD